MLHRVLMWAFIAAMSLPPVGALAQPQPQIGGVGLTIFADRNFRGRSATLRDDTPDLRTIGMNNAASSLRVGTLERWEVCEQAHYRGRCVVMSGAEADLRRTGWNRLISSARRVRGAGVRPPAQPGRPRLELFSRTGFSGNRQVFSEAEADFRRIRFNDAAQSLRIAPGDTWQVCVDVNFSDCVVVNADWRDLRGLGMSRRISSVRPWRQTGRR
jgi:Beta/Gamma crystallin